MNNERRKELTKIVDRIDALKSELETLRDDIDSLQGEERDGFENLPESFQQGYKGQAMEAAADAMQEAYDAIDAAASSADEAIEAINRASE